MSRRLLGKNLALGVLGLAVLVQGWLAADTFVLPFYAHFLGLSGRSMVERSAQLTYGGKFAGYMRFLRDQIPQDALVIQPSFRNEPIFGHQGFMQYFLFPRDVRPCPVEITWVSCLKKYNGPNTYILAVDDFPPAFPPQVHETYLGYGTDRGLFIPVSGQDERP